MRSIRFFLVLVTVVVFSTAWKESRVEKTKTISIGIGQLTVPESWIMQETDDGPWHFYILISEKDTIRFGDFPSRVHYELMIEHKTEVVIEHTDSGDHYYRDTSYDAENRRIRKYNDSIIALNPEIVTNCDQYFMATDSSFHFYTYAPCHTDPGKISGFIYRGKAYTGGSIDFESTLVTPAKAEEFISILKSFQPSR